MFDVSDNVQKINVINRRLFIITAAKILVFIGLTSRLFSLQVNQSNKYLTLSDKNRIREWKLHPVRGEFKDYFDNVIAGNNEVYQLHVIPEQVEDFRYIALRLKNILNLSEKDFKKLIKKKNEKKAWETIGNATFWEAGRAKPELRGEIPALSSRPGRPAWLGQSL